MRPVERGPVPETDAGAPKTFSSYTQARGDLIDRLGEYCSYCEMHLDTSLAVEHIQPKSLYPDLEKSWDNFLLACTNCNSIKGNQNVSLNDCFWPQRDNTFLALEYSSGGVVNPNPSLHGQDRGKAEKIIRLVGLDKRPGRSPRRSDRRWLNRREAWDKAEETLLKWTNNPITELAETIVLLVKARGYWSVWMTVFKDDPEMLRRFIEALPGTAEDCFDENGKPLPRNSGSI